MSFSAITPLLLAASLCATPAAAGPAMADEDAEVELLLDADFPLEVTIPFHPALLHWLDSLTGLSGAGLTGGKTQRAHQQEYDMMFGSPVGPDLEILARYRAVRHGFTLAEPPARRDALTLAFFGSSTLDEALVEARRLLNEDDAEGLAVAMRYFAARYRQVWDNGRIPASFLDRVRSDRRRRGLSLFLISVARFLGVEPPREIAPRLILVPVERGHGTHAQAIGRYLLIEIRPNEGLSNEVSPIVHETAHFLFSRIDRKRLSGMRRLAARYGPAGIEAWGLLHEALPTAIGQGVAGKSFAPRGWSRDRPWYHRPEVDLFAKRLYPLVRRALAEGERFDEAFLAAAFQAQGVRLPSGRSTRSGSYSPITLTSTRLSRRPSNSP